MSIPADVLTKTPLGKLKADKAAPRMAPPVPIKPVKNPDAIPPPTALILLAFNFKSGLRRKAIANVIRKMPIARPAIPKLKTLFRYAPKSVKMTLGIPIFRMRGKLICRLKIKSFEEELKINTMPDKTSAVLKSKNSPANGTKNTDAPKPLSVPIISHIKTRNRKMLNSMPLFIMSFYMMLKLAF